MYGFSQKGNSEYDPCNIKKLNYDNFNSVDLTDNNMEATSKCTAWEFAPRSTGETIVSEVRISSFFTPYVVCTFNFIRSIISN